jgi:hypothetical protein
VDRIGAGTEPRIRSGASSETSAGAGAGPVASLSRPRTFTYAFSGNSSINSRRRRISNSPFGDAPVVSSSRFSCATTSASVEARAPNALRAFANIEVRTTAFALSGPSVRPTGEVTDVDRVGAGLDSGVWPGEVFESAFCGSADTTASAAGRAIASLRSPSTSSCANPGSGSINSRRCRVSNSSVADAPAASSTFSSARTSVYAKLPVSNARKILSNTVAGDDVLEPWVVVRRPPKPGGRCEREGDSGLFMFRTP